jgi:hypothetical protein
MLQLSLDNVGELPRFCDRRRRLSARDRNRRGRSRSYLSGFTRSTQCAEMFPDLVGQLVVQRTGMRLLLNPEYSKILDDEVTLDLQFTRQNVDSYVTHSLFLITLPCFPPISSRAG